MRFVSAVSAVILLIEAFLLIFTVGSQDSDKYHYCNATDCTYTASSEYAQCKSLGLVKIPSECSSAVYLDFRRNDLQYLNGNSLTNFVKLKYLYLEGNQIRNITPRAFQACPALQQIFLQNNPIVIIEGQVFAELSDLRHLYLNVAQLQIIQPHAFDDLRALERLYLSDNSLEFLPHNLFHDLTNLQILTLANNQLQSLARDTFHGLARLEYLDIKHNKLTSLPNGLFNGMFRLNELTISYNVISKIEEGAINSHELHNLEKLDMQNNTIRSVSNFSSVFPDIPKLYLAGNPIYCDCRNNLLLIWYESSATVNDSRTNIICQAPPSLIGQPIKSVAHNPLSCDKQKPEDYPEQGTLPTLSVQYTKMVLISSPKADNGPLPINSVEQTVNKENSALIGQNNQITDDQNTDDQNNDNQNNDNQNTDNQNTNGQSHGSLRFTGICITVTTALVLTLVLIIACWKCRSNNEHKEEDKPPRNENAIPNAETHINIMDNPFLENGEEVNDLYEPVSNMPNDSQNRLQSDSTYLDSDSEEDFPPDTKNESDFPPQPLPPSSHPSSPRQQVHPSFPSTGYVPHTTMPSPPSSQHPQIMHSFSVPPQSMQLHLHSQRDMPAVKLGGISYPPANPFNVPPYPGRQTPHEIVPGHTQSHKFPMSFEMPTQDHCKCANKHKPTNPFCTTEQSLPCFNPVPYPHVMRVQSNPICT